MPILNRAANTQRAGQTGGSCPCCRGGACKACQNCPNCPSCRQGAQNTMNQLRDMQKQDPTGTQNGVNDAFKQNGDLANNQILMKILQLLGIQAPGGAQG